MSDLQFFTKFIKDHQAAARWYAVWRVWAIPTALLLLSMAAFVVVWGTITVPDFLGAQMGLVFMLRLATAIVLLTNSIKFFNTLTRCGWGVREYGKRPFTDMVVLQEVLARAGPKATERFLRARHVMGVAPISSVLLVAKQCLEGTTNNRGTILQQQIDAAEKCRVDQVVKS